MQYDHGHRTTQHLFEMTPLEAAIQQYEELANKHYTERLSMLKASGKEKKRAEASLAKAQQFLLQQRRHIRNLASIQLKLAEYQTSGNEIAEIDPEALLEEKHHPTKVLARNMTADANPRPSSRHSAHHIVAGKGIHPRTADIRLVIHFAGIRINDPDNGVWLPIGKSDKGHWAMPSAPAHSEIHTFNYETWVNYLLGPLDSEVTIRSALNRIRSLLRDGQQPPQVTMKKDTSWAGY